MGPRPESSLFHRRHFRTALALAGFFLLLCVYAGLHARSQPYATPGDMLMAARIHAARHADGGEWETSWCDEGSITHLGADRYYATGCVEGRWGGVRRPRRFEAVVLRRQVLSVTQLPVVEFRFLD